ncbi:MAG: hypothetical protein DCF19_21275 [Pseudanabaena frigida]|uniref:Uncharacterized protein n=1 Tax=Pseudanabaena frigida TaxID=945775 RepID=A0A2W4VW03_9CYAN|nr:MAG: hypothetical protein DCF19_21275 [Pseudanabaena frigida]
MGDAGFVFYIYWVMQVKTKYQRLKGLAFSNLSVGFRFLAIAMVMVCILIGIGCQPAPVANSQTQVDSAIVTTIYTCRAQVTAYGDKPMFDVEFDFEDRQFPHLPVVTKRRRTNQEQEEIYVWDALYGSDGDYDYWTTPILREYTLEKISPLVVIRESSRTSYANTLAKLNATLSVDFRHKHFPVICTANSISSASSTPPKLVQINICRTQIGQGTQPLLDVEFDYLTETSLQKRYPYEKQNIYVKTTTLLKQNEGQVRQFEALVGSDGDYSFWTTPVLRDIYGGTSPLVIDREPGVVGIRDRLSLVSQLNKALSVNFGQRTYPVTCS